MPLWTIYHSANAFTTAEERDEFAADITASYAALPPFYVVVTFVPLQQSYIYRSGNQITSDDKPFVRLVISHLARHASDNPEGLEAGHTRAKAVVDKPLQKHVVDRGYEWEYTISEDSRELWKIDGFVPPPFNGAAFKDWKENNRAGPY